MSQVNAWVKCCSLLGIPLNPYHVFTHITFILPHQVGAIIIYPNFMDEELRHKEL